MLLDSHGKRLTRRIGFRGGLEVERGPRRSASLVSAIGCERVWPERDEEDGEETEAGQAEAFSVEHEGDGKDI